VEVKQYRASGGVCKGTFPNSSHQRKSNRSFMYSRRFWPEMPNPTPLATDSS